METTDRKTHWENIYQTKALETVSWYQPEPVTSLGYFDHFEVRSTAAIIDIGGGDSFLSDCLLSLGYTDLTVLDISNSALERAQVRLGAKSRLIKWIAADASAFTPTREYDVWHDRAAFHFLTSVTERDGYVDAVRKGVKPGGLLIVSTFSERGPKKCSGLEISQYSETSLSEIFMPWFDKVKCTEHEHPTPAGTSQSFVFCVFRKL